MTRKFPLQIVALYIVATTVSGYAEADDSVSVRGHFRKDGTYVPPHYRSAPDSSFYNNWGTTGNINPYTGKAGTLDYSPNVYGGYGYRSSLPLNIPNTPYLPPDYLPPAPSDTLSDPSEPSAPPEFHIPQHAKLNYFRNGWECEHGFRQSGNECVAVQIPRYAKLNYFGNSWECERGFRQTGNECVEVTIPSNAKLNYWGHNWECERGFRQTGNECVTISIPANGKLNYWGNGWECERGYRQNGADCVAVQVPQNARLNYWGNGWECVEGFRPNSTSCTSVGTQ